MARGQVFTDNFLRGLQTTAHEDGLPFPGFSVFENARVSDGRLRRRSGMALAGAFGNDNGSLDFDAASSEYILIPVDTRVWALPVTFTLEVLVAPDVVTGTRPVLYAGATTPSLVVDTDGSSNWRVRFWDSSATLTTLTAAAATTDRRLQVVRDDTTLTLRIDGTDADSDAVAAGLSSRTPAGNVLIASDGTNYYDGKIDYLRLFGIARTHQRDGFQRFPDPRCSYCLADYGMEANANDIVRDRSRLGNHGKAQNTPTAAAALCDPAAPVRAIRHYQDQGRGRLLVVAGGRVHVVSVT